MGQKKEVKGFNVEDFFNEEPLTLTFAFLKMQVRMLTPADAENAKRSATISKGGSRKDKHDDDKYAESLLGACVLSWEHVEGGKLLRDGKELKCTPENVFWLANNLTGLANHILSHVQSADTMYRTLKEQEIKN